MGTKAKLRTSCDSCQTAKVKCGHEKPSCRRCSNQRVNCVYSLSRRMGRPRAKDGISKDSACREEYITSQDRVRSKSTTPIAGFTDSETAIAVAGNQMGETRASGLPVTLTDLNQIPGAWMPTVGDIEPANANTDADTDGNSNVHGNSSANARKIVDDNIMHPMTSPSSAPGELDFLLNCTPMELDDISGFLDGLSPSADFFEPQALLPSGVSLPSQKSTLFESIGSHSPMQQQLLVGSNNNDGSGQFSRAASLSGQSNTASSSQPFDFTFDFLSDMGSSSSQDNCSSVSSNPSRNATLMPPGDQRQAHCNCIATILKCIGSLKTEQQKTRSIPIDNALIMESEVEESLARIHRCKNCRLDSTVHLLALVSVRMMLDLLQKTAHSEFVLRRTAPRQMNIGNQARALSQSPHRPGSADEAARQPSSLQDGAILYIGNFKVTPKARFRFLRKVLQARFYKLVVLVEEGEKLVNGISEDCFAKPASLLLGDISRGLRTIIGWVELWNSKHL